jgi:hypothetical protein
MTVYSGLRLIASIRTFVEADWCVLARKAARHRPVREMNPESWQVAGCCNAFDIASPVANPD